MGAPDHAGTVDVVVLTVIPAELEAARRSLGIEDGSREKDPDGTVYFRGAVRSSLHGRDYRIALTCIGSAGNPGAAAATTTAIARYRPRAVLLIGIAAGVRDKSRSARSCCRIASSPRRVWRLGWLLFMQPLALSRMYQAWGMSDDLSAARLLPQVLRGNRTVRQLLTKYALLLIASCLFGVTMSRAVAWYSAPP